MLPFDSIAGFPYLDYTETMPVPRTPEFREQIKVMAARIKQLTEKLDIEFILAESPANGYIPAPPEGWTAFRSQKRRLFVRGGKIDEKGIDWMIKNGQAVALPLSPATK